MPNVKQSKSKPAAKSPARQRAPRIEIDVSRLSPAMLPKRQTLRDPKQLRFPAEDREFIATLAEKLETSQSEMYRIAVRFYIDAVKNGQSPRTPQS